MNNFHRAILLYYGSYPGLRAAKTLRVSTQTISKWKHAPHDPKPFVFIRLLDNIEKREEEVDRKADSLVARIEHWRSHKKKKITASKMALLAGLNRSSPTEKEEATLAALQPRLRAQQPGVAFRLPASSASPPEDGATYQPQTKTRKVANKDSPPGQYRQKKTITCTPQSQGLKIPQELNNLATPAAPSALLQECSEARPHDEQPPLLGQTISRRLVRKPVLLSARESRPSGGQKGTGQGERQVARS